MGGILWTYQELMQLRKRYPNELTATIAASLGRSLRATYSQAKIMGLRKTADWIKQNSRESVMANPEKYKKGQFKKGAKPWNDGISVRLSQKSKFKKGDLPHNTLHDGAISIRKDTTGRSYKYIRKSLGKWSLLQRDVWEKAHGIIPKKMIVAFKDGDSLNCDLINLELITRKENMDRNTIHRFPPELKTTIRSLKKLRTLINDYEK